VEEWLEQEEHRDSLSFAELEEFIRELYEAYDAHCEGDDLPFEERGEVYDPEAAFLASLEHQEDSDAPRLTPEERTACEREAANSPDHFISAMQRLVSAFEASRDIQYATRFPDNPKGWSIDWIVDQSVGLLVLPPSESEPPLGTHKRNIFKLGYWLLSTSFDRETRDDKRPVPDDEIFAGIMNGARAAYRNAVAACIGYSENPEQRRGLSFAEQQRLRGFCDGLLEAMSQLTNIPVPREFGGPVRA
jgi:hypothetical protein